MIRTVPAATRRGPFTRPLLALSAATLIFSAACTEIDPNDGRQNTRTGAAGGAALGAIAGAALSRDSKKGALIGGVAGALAGAAYGDYLDRQEAALRSELGSNVQIVNTGDRLVVTMPQDILFATDSASLRPDLTTDLVTVARSLNEYPRTTVQVVGHTDNTGDAAYNQQLSARRASAVANVLINSGVSAGRIQSFGRGEDQPRATNLTPEGRQLNRRVDIVILPTT
ncbi:OmpA family protein [Pseudooceanicola batsensis HTCC2597]|uniref:OmpA family protein n=1 Tax=Pseudooceanicola batsensis (strain ATCC BAA-863 / DSM 15984 / KCTC 12145 / HTCC2597) TaxID=252305 RepID=A3U3X4_PSEBH|nr:OmpA family protein [Pseudooceanicola batsensis]EAQ01110.1 OmpA family protein [Pseudooceanicola batsensis HTCC2597]